MDYETISYIVYACISVVAVIVAIIVKVCEAKFGKTKVAETLSEAEKYQKAIAEAITSAEEMFPNDKTGKQKKVVATLAVSNVVNTLVDYKPTAEQISNDIDNAVAITKQVNTKSDATTEADTASSTITTRNDAE